MTTGNAAIALLRPRRLGVLYVAGSVLCLTTMVLAVHAPLLGLTFAALVIAGTDLSGFTVSQATLVLQASPAQRRSHTTGILSTAIATTPIGTLLMGITSTTFDTATAVTISGAVGLGMPALCLPLCRPILRGTPHDHSGPAEEPVLARADQEAGTPAAEMAARPLRRRRCGSARRPGRRAAATATASR